MRAKGFWGTKYFALKINTQKLIDLQFLNKLCNVQSVEYSEKAQRRSKEVTQLEMDKTTRLAN